MTQNTLFNVSTNCGLLLSKESLFCTFNLVSNNLTAMGNSNHSIFEKDNINQISFAVLEEVFHTLIKYLIEGLKKYIEVWMMEAEIYLLTTNLSEVTAIFLQKY